MIALALVLLLCGTAEATTRTEDLEQFYRTVAEAAETVEANTMPTGTAIPEATKTHTPTNTATKTHTPTPTGTKPPTLTATPSDTAAPTTAPTTVPTLPTGSGTCSSAIKVDEILIDTPGGPVRSFRIHEHDGQLMAVWAHDRGDTKTDLLRVRVSANLTHVSPLETLVTVKTKHPQWGNYQELLSAASGENGQWALVYIDNARYRFRLYEREGNSVEIPLTIALYDSGEGGDSYVEWDAREKSWHTAFYAVCQGVHLCTYASTIRPGLMYGPTWSFMEGDVAHQLDPAIAVSPIGRAYLAHNHPKSGGGTGGTKSRFQGARGLGGPSYVLDSRYNHDRWGDIAWNKHFGALWVEVNQWTTGYPWGEPGDWSTRFALFDQTKYKLTPITDLALVEQHFTGYGDRSIRIAPFLDGFIATYPWLGPTTRQAAWQFISSEGVPAPRVAFGEVAVDAFSAIGIGDNVYTAIFGFDGLRVARYLCAK